MHALVDEALTRAGALISVEGLARAWGSREAGPHRWLVIGRQGVGKSRLVNALVDSDAAVGLGGVTSEVTAYQAEHLVLLDSPALEDEFDGMDLIEAHLQTVDGLLWVVDGLQPLTALERRIVDRVVPPWVGVVAAVTRLDLVDGTEHDAILNRVSQLLQHRALQGPVPASEVALLRQALTRPPWRASPRRRAELRMATTALGQALAHLSPNDEGMALAEWSAQVCLDWRAAVGVAHEAVVERVRNGEILFRDQALAALGEALDRAAAEVRATIAQRMGQAPQWRPTPPEAMDVWGQARDLVAGTPGVLRGLREGAAAWAAEGEIAFAALDQLPAAVAERRRTEAWDRAMAAVHALAESLPPE